MSPPTASARLDPRALDEVFERLAASVEAGVVPAAGLGIGDADGPLRSEAFGGPGDPVDRESVFYLASLTKPIVATAVMQLVEQGLLDLHAPVAQHLPAFATPDKERVTAWHLLTHTSGISDIPAEVIRRQRPSARRMTELAATAALRFEPGTRWEYCGSASFYVLGELIRQRSGLPYPRYLRERLLEPLAIHHVSFDPRRLGRRLVPVHGVGADNRLTRFLMLRYLVSIAAPGGGLWGTLDDLLLFGAALLRPRPVAGGRLAPLAPSTIELMGEDQTRGLAGTVEGEERRVHFGLGWGKPTLMYDLPGSPRVISHGGATGTRLWIDPDAGLVFVYFTNRWGPERGPEAVALRATYRALEAG